MLRELGYEVSYAGQNMQEMPSHIHHLHAEMTLVLDIISAADPVITERPRTES